VWIRVNQWPNLFLRAHELAFATQDGRKKQLALTPETYDRLAKNGLNAELSFQVAPGVYGLREVVQEAVAGKLSSATHSVDLR
jgi:hypothetical protein